MRESTKYLIRVPIEIALAIAIVWTYWYGLFLILEAGSGMTSKIHDELPYFAMVMALIIGINCLILMLMEYAERRISERALEKYLVKLGAMPMLAGPPMPVGRKENRPGRI